MLNNFFEIENFTSKIGIIGKIISIDYGEKNIGIATTDELRIISSPIDVLRNDDKFIQNIKEIINKIKPKGIVIGYPLDQDGNPKQLCSKIEKFSETLSNEFNLPILFLDERMSTKGSQCEQIYSGEHGKSSFKNQKSKLNKKISIYSSKDKKKSYKEINHDWEIKDNKGKKTKISINNIIKIDDHLAASYILESFLKKLQNFHK